MKWIAGTESKLVCGLSDLICMQSSPFFQNYELKLDEKILGDGSFSICR